MKTTFTDQQIADWRAFERVRQSGAFNMFDPRARAAAGLSGEQYAYVMENYSELKDADASTHHTYAMKVFLNSLFVGFTIGLLISNAHFLWRTKEVTLVDWMPCVVCALLAIACNEDSK